MKRLLMALMLVCFPCKVYAMPAAEFATRWTALQRQDRQAIMESSDFTVLTQAFAQAAKAYRAQIDAARADGHIPRACPPNPINLTAKDLAASIIALPQATQQQELPVVLALILDRRYPCQAT